MFGLRKKKIVHTVKNYSERATYKQVAVTPAAHTKLREIADRTNASIIDTVDHLVGV